MRNRYVIGVLSIISIILVYFSGCGRSSQPETDASEADVSEFVTSYEDGNGDSFFLNSTIKNISYELPSLNEEWVNETERDYGLGTRVSESYREKDGLYYIRKSTKVFEDKIYLLDDICGDLITSYVTIEGDWYYPKNPWRRKYGTLITVIEGDGSTESYIINRYDYSEDGDILITDILGVDENDSILLYMSDEFENSEFYLGIYDIREGCRVIGKLPDTCNKKKGCFSDGYLYFSYFSNNVEDNNKLNYTKTVYAVSINRTDESKFSSYDFYIKGFCRENDGTVLVYGVDDNKNFYICDPAEGKLIKKTELSEMNGSAQNSVFLASLSEDESVLYVTDGRMLWIISGEEQAVAYLMDNDIMTDEIIDIAVNDGGFRLYAGYEGDDVIYDVKLMRGSKNEKTKVRLAASYKDPVLEEFVASYNRSSPDYEIVIETGYPVMSNDDFAREIVTQIAAGEGPELVNDFLIPPLQPCRNGTYEVLDDIIDEISNEDIIPAALECGKVDGHQYGIPWLCSPFYCVSSGDFLGDMDSWTLNECIEKTSASEYSYFGLHVDHKMSPEQIVMFLGLYDLENPDLIDWDKGKSNLESDAFIRLIEFAKEYGGEKEINDHTDYSDKNEDEDTAACNYDDSVGGINLEYYELLYKQNDSVWIGFPSNTGSAAYMNGSCLYVISGSKNKEGAKDFLKYFISESGQEKYARIALKNKGYERLSLSTKALNVYIDSFNKTVANESLSWLTKNGKVEIEPLTDDMILNYKNLLLTARPIRKELTPIEEIIDEEMIAYIAGQKSAAETAKVIDSRVQIYLDETRK